MTGVIKTLKKRVNISDTAIEHKGVIEFAKTEKLIDIRLNRIDINPEDFNVRIDQRLTLVRAG